MSEIENIKYGGVWYGRHLVYLRQVFSKMKFTFGLEILRWFIKRRIKSIKNQEEVE